MSESAPDTKDTNPPRYPKAQRRRNTLSRLLVWLVPIAVIGVCGYLIDDHVLRAGPEIDIAFAGTVQVEANKTPLRYKGVEIGRVKAVSLSDDLQKVIVHVRLENFARDFAKDATQFWVVRPEITSSGIEGIETLTEGAYITALPGKGDDQDYFEGLSDDPARSMGPDSMKVVLYTDHLDKLKVGSAVTLRGVAIGEVSAIELDKSGEFVRIALFVRAPYRQFINSSTHFDYAGGVQAAFDMKTGLKLKLPSLQTLISGSIDVVTPNRSAPPLDTKTLQKLNPTPAPDDDSKKIAADSLKLTLTAHKIVKLSEGSEVRYRGLPVGQVDSIILSKGNDDVHVQISINPQYQALVNQSSKFWYSNGIQTNFSLFGGASVQVAGLPVLLNGAIDFITPDKDATPLPKNAIGPLFDNYQKEWGPQ